MKRTTPEEHRWVVDGIEEGMARVEEDGTRVFTVPVSLLPPDVREGQLLRVTRSASPGSATLTVTLDEAATTAALAASKAQVEKIAKASKKRDPGGDVAL